ncbi:MAG: RsmD family RNA methyltransferase, partial [Deltaproteobacteria bacterium]|nr:RsmD family RNA methyltransferase [Deltaproteobacteria bacterium]
VRQQRFNLVLLDPPYALEPWPTVSRLLELGLLAEEALVVVEHASRNEAPGCIGCGIGQDGVSTTLEVIKQRCYGDTALALYAFADEFE